jgi:hypothetical protein
VQPYIKAVATLVATALTALATAVGNGSLDDIDGQGWVKLALVVLGSTAAVWFAENVPGAFGGVIKAVLAGSTAFLTALTAAYENDAVISQGEWLTAFGAALRIVAWTARTSLRGKNVTRFSAAATTRHGRRACARRTLPGSRSPIRMWGCCEGVLRAGALSR